jgi:hypothetical protein
MTDKKTELFDMEIHEIALVKSPANRKRFLVLKMNSSLEKQTGSVSLFEVLEQREKARNWWEIESAIAEVIRNISTLTDENEKAIALLMLVDDFKKAVFSHLGIENEATSKTEDKDERNEGEESAKNINEKGAEGESVDEEDTNEKDTGEENIDKKDTDEEGTNEKDMDEENIDEKNINEEDEEELEKRATEQDKKKQQQRAKKYGISPKPAPIGNVTMPKRYRELGLTPNDFADPVNFKYPITRQFILPALRYSAHKDAQKKGQYSDREWKIIISRIENAARKFKVGRFKKETQKDVKKVPISKFQEFIQQKVEEKLNKTKKICTLLKEEIEKIVNQKL